MSTPSGSRDVPPLRHFYEPILRVLAAAGHPLTRFEVASAVADHLHLDPLARAQTIPSGRHVRYVHRTGWATFSLRRAGLVEYPSRGTSVLTPAGRAYLTDHPDPLDDGQLAAFIQRLHEPDPDPEEETDDDDDEPDEADFGTWLRDKVLASYSDEAVRRRALSTMAAVIRHAHVQRPSCWAVTRRPGRLRVLVGETVAFDIGRGFMRIGLHLRSIPESHASQVEPDLGKPDGPFVRVESGVLRVISAARFEAGVEILAPAWRRFVELAAARFPNTPYARFHLHESTPELERLVGEALPRPAYAFDATPRAAAELVASGLAGLSAERLATRAKAIADARALIETKRNALTEPDARALLRLFNTDLTHGRVTYNRFSPAFVGHLANRLVADMEELNRWISALWSAPHEEIDETLDAFWAADTVAGAGTSLPTMILHVRDPEIYPPLMPGLAAGYHRLTGQRATRRKGSIYRRYADRVVELREAHDIPAHGVDIVLLEAGRVASERQEQDPQEPVPEPPPSTGETYDRIRLIDETGLPPQSLDEIEALLRDKPQLVLCGAPGTGKTYLAERLAAYLVREGGEWKLVQFHPSYGYEDFIEGIRPRTSAGAVTTR